MATKFPKFSQALAQDPTTRRIWFGIATAHDFESHDGMTEERLYQKIFASHFGQLAIIFLWTSGTYSMLHGKATLNNGFKTLYISVQSLMRSGTHILVNLLLKHLHVAALQAL